MAGSDLRADSGEWQNEIKARGCALRANIAQFPCLSIRAVRPEDERAVEIDLKLFVP
jgi:hypothetical protein